MSGRVGNRLVGRADIVANPPWVAGQYYRATIGSVTTSAALTQGVATASPVFVPASCTLDRIGAEVTTIGEAGSKLRLGIYNDNGGMLPGTLLLDAGQIDGDSATVQEITISQALSRGWYWFVAAAQSCPTTPPTTRCSTAAPMAILPLGTSMSAGKVRTGSSATAVTGALPASWTAGTGGLTTVHSLHFRVA